MIDLIIFNETKSKPVAYVFEMALKSHRRTLYKIVVLKRIFFFWDDFIEKFVDIKL